MFTLIIICFFTLIINAQEKIKLNTKKSTITWEGSKLFGFGSHDGTVYFKEGEVVVKDSKIINGSFIIDMNSIKSNEKETWVYDLIEHLKSKDFFDVKNNSTSIIVFTNIKYVGDGFVQITADLTINKITKSVFFVAKQNDTKKQLETRLKIDRTDFKITYKSQGETSIKDQIISDAISFKVLLNF
ncbi:Polyisoprenoid-binding protein YceI [Polaribacter sp. KT25b]|uniref:YceI family protein n=1 Tax=Polaribacter sp. KT25b TaxID=1855336 RepID=UPI00087B05F3|nr:YceI family protein [Polaribacter sp. KT25b]SDS54598.1 Polyisoprenoid-binding protein YceI [Polaribacter sp. KT25b]